MINYSKDYPLVHVPAVFVGTVEVDGNGFAQFRYQGGQISRSCELLPDYRLLKKKEDCILSLTLRASKGNPVVDDVSLICRSNDSTFKGLSQTQFDAGALGTLRGTVQDVNVTYNQARLFTTAGIFRLRNVPRELLQAMKPGAEVALSVSLVPDLQYTETLRDVLAFRVLDFADGKIK